MKAMTVAPATDAAFRDIWLSILPLYFHAYTPAYAQLFATTHYSAAGYVVGAACMATYNVVPQLDQLRVPTLMLQGSDDFITPPSQARRIPHATVVELTASGHFPFGEEAPRYLSALRDWLRTNLVG